MKLLVLNWYYIIYLTYKTTICRKTLYRAWKKDSYLLGIKVE